MSTWFPESPADDGSAGVPDRTARPFSGSQQPGSQRSDQQRSDSYPERYGREQYPMAPGEPPELPSRRSQPGGAGLFDAVPGPLSPPVGGGGLFDPVLGPPASPSPPGPARAGQETEFLPTGRPVVDADGYGDPGQPAVPQAGTGTPSDAAPYDASAAPGRRADRGNPPRPPASSTRGNTPSTRGNGPRPLIPHTGASLGSGPGSGYPEQQPAPGYPEQQPAPGYAEPRYAGQQYPDQQQYVDPQYGDQQYAEPQRGGRRAGRDADEPQRGGAGRGDPAHAEPAHVELPHGEPPHGDQQYSDHQYSDHQYSDHQYSDHQYSDQQYSDQQYGDHQYSDHQYSDEPATSPPASGPARSRGGELHGRAPGQSLSRMLAASAWPVVAVGLFVSEGGSSAFGRTPAWSAFALACLVLVAVGAFGGPQGPGSGRTWTLGVVGVSGLVAFWVLLVLPDISRNTSFALTLGVALASIALWLTPGRRRF